jgi:hypothetical protein
MIQIRYSSPNQLEISGNINDLQMIQQALLNLAQLRSSGINEIFADPVSDPSPYNHALSKLGIQVGYGPTTIAVLENNSVLIMGSPDNLERLASFFDFSSNESAGMHSHYEYYEGNPYIAADAIPLVVSLQG